MFTKEDFKSYCDWIDKENKLIEDKNKKIREEWKKDYDSLSWFYRNPWEAQLRLVLLLQSKKRVSQDGFMNYMKDQILM